MTNKSVRDRQREGSGRDSGGKRLVNKMAEIEVEEEKEDLGEKMGGRGGTR